MTNKPSSVIWQMAFRCISNLITFLGLISPHPIKKLDAFGQEHIWEGTDWKHGLAIIESLHWANYQFGHQVIWFLSFLLPFFLPALCSSSSSLSLPALPLSLFLSSPDCLCCLSLVDWPMNLLSVQCFCFPITLAVEGRSLSSFHPGEMALSVFSVLEIF